MSQVHSRGDRLWVDLESAFARDRQAQNRQGLMVACIEEIAFKMGYIGALDVLRIAEPMRKNSYGQYLLRLVESGA